MEDGQGGDTIVRKQNVLMKILWIGFMMIC